MSVLRWIAMAIAIASIWDPGVAVPRRQHPAIDVLSSPDATSGRIAERLRRDLTSVGFGVNGGRSPVARVVVADRPPVGLPADVPLFAVDTSDRGFALDPDYPRMVEPGSGARSVRAAAGERRGDRRQGGDRRASSGGQRRHGCECSPPVAGGQ